MGRGLGNQGGWQTKEKKQKKKHREARRTERHTEQMKHSERIRRDSVGYNRGRKEAEDQVCGFKKQRAEIPEKEKNWPKGTKTRRQWLRERKDRTGKIAGRLVRQGGGRELKQPGRWGGGDGV